MNVSKLAGHTTYGAVIAEMDNGDGQLVPVDAELLQGVTDPDDTKPMFVTMEVINEGVSRNGRKWTKELIADIAQQINSKRPDGYMGHLKEDERSHKAPEPVIIWLGATVSEVQGKVRLFAKGYVLPQAKSLRTYIRSCKAAGKNIAVSVYGTTKNAVRDAATGALALSNFDLESIDMARSGSEGVQNMGMFMITSEMTDDSNPKGDEMTKEDALKSASSSELKELNPTVVSEITNEAVSAKEAEHATVVSEMASIKELVGDKPAETIAEMQSELKDLKLTDALREKVDAPEARKVIRALVVSEMAKDSALETAAAVDKVLGSEEGKSIVQEMVEKAPTIQPSTKQPVVKARKFTKVI